MPCQGSEMSAELQHSKDAMRDGETAEFWEKASKRCTASIKSVNMGTQEAPQMIHGINFNSAGVKRKRDDDDLDIMDDIWDNTGCSISTAKPSFSGAGSRSICVTDVDMLFI
jgi:hypothetical protein